MISPNDAHPYPKRDSCFAHRFVRLLHKSCAIQEIGLDGFALLVIVAHTEDAIRYKGPVGFWNQTLLEILGMAKWDQLAKAREKCINCGWLKYHGDGKRTPGQYFVTIPENYLQLDDGPIDHQYTLVNPETRYKQGYDEGYKAGYDAGYKAGDVQRDVQGEPFCPIPCIPDPLNTEETKKSKTFSVPSVDDVAGYVKEIGATIDPQQFLDYYEARNWMSGKTKITRWKAAVRTWQKNQKSSEPQPAKKARLTSLEMADKRRRGEITSQEFDAWAQAEQARTDD